jgi:putative endopeptidase
MALADAGATGPRDLRDLSRDEYLRQTLLATPHAPPEFRANGPASNMAAFHEAVGTKPGDGMYREPGSRITIW